jgi:hypothetical protein
MGLERFDPEDHNPLQWDGQMVARADGEYYRAADVDALLARIRAAVAAERASMRETNGAVLPGAALDALLADGGA